MQTSPFVSAEKPAVTGHSFAVQTYEACAGCHPNPAGLIDLAFDSVTMSIDAVKKALDTWALTKAPPQLQKYGILAWEYTTIGELSSGGPGPNSQEQALIPDNIKKARFNMYVVQNDGSFGVHNGRFALDLLDAAQSWVLTELNK